MSTFATVIAAKSALLPTGWADDVIVRLNEGRIERVETAAIPPSGAYRVDILLPAPVNLHSHAFQRAMAGLAERRAAEGRESFWTWREAMYRLVAALAPEDVEAIAALAYAEMLEAGFAGVVEFHYLHHDQAGKAYANPAEMSVRIVRAAAETGIGLTLCPTLYRYGGVDRRPLGPAQRRFGCTPEGYARLIEAAEEALFDLGPDARLGLAAHSLRAVAPEDLAFLRSLRPKAPFHMHLAEQPAEVAEVEAALGARPVAWALAALAIDRPSCFVHCTQMVARETEALARSGAVAGLCPVTEASLGDGIFDGMAYVEAGGLWGVGTDSNIRISLAEELCTLEYGQRLASKTRAALAPPGGSTGRTLWQGALAGGAKAAGRATGAIAPGLWADLLSLDGEALDLAGLAGDALLDAFVFAQGANAVRDVWAAGRHVVVNGRHIARTAIERAYRKRIGQLRA